MIPNATISILQTVARTAYYMKGGRATPQEATDVAVNAAELLCRAMVKHDKSIHLGHTKDEYRSALCAYNPNENTVLSDFAKSVSGDLNLFVYNMICDCQSFLMADFVKLFKDDKIILISMDDIPDDSAPKDKQYFSTDLAFLALPAQLLSIEELTLFSITASLVFEIGNDIKISPEQTVINHRYSAELFARKHKLRSNDDLVAALKDFESFRQLSPAIYSNAQKLHEFISMPESIDAILKHREQQKLSFPTA